MTKISDSTLTTAENTDLVPIGRPGDNIARHSTVASIVSLASGGGGSFAFDGVTFTPGEFVADSGFRDVEIELTLDGEAITSGVMIIWLAITDTADFSSGDDWSYIYNFNSSSIGYSGFLGEKLVIILLPSADGHCKTTTDLINEDSSPVDRYISIFLPSGALATSEVISVPGYVE